jgi:hypothetical protein
VPALEKQIGDDANALDAVQKAGGFLREEVTEDDIAAVVAKWTGIPVERMLEGEVERLSTMEDRLGSRVVGQNEAVDVRMDIYSNVVFAGGNTMFDGMYERCYRDLASLSPRTVKIKLVFPPERYYSAWIGGSIVGSLSTTSGLIRKEDYWEDGMCSLMHCIC